MLSPRQQTNREHRTGDVTQSQPINEKPLVNFSGQSVLDVPESGRFAAVPNHVCRLSTKRKSIFCPRLVESRFRCGDVLGVV